MALWVSSVQSCPRNKRTTAQPTSMDLQSDMGSRPLQGGKTVLPGTDRWYRLRGKISMSQDHFTLYCKDKGILPVASA